MRIIFGLILFFSLPVFADPIDAQIRWVLSGENSASESDATKIQALDAELTSLERTDGPRLADAEKLAVELLKEKSLQEALWALRRGQSHHAADILEAGIVDILKRAELQLVTSIGFGVTGADRISLPGGIQVIRKFRDPQWGAETPSFEVLAYRLDQLLNLNRVPLTILREDSMRGQFSLQLFLPDAESGWGFYKSRYLPKSDLGLAPTELDEIFAFDFLLQVTDRHERNIMITRNGRIALIDNGRILKPSHSEIFPTTIAEYKAAGGIISPRLLARLHALHGYDFPKAFHGLVELREVEQISARWRELIAAFPLSCEKDVL